MTTPYSTRPKITQLDISNGFVTRYFVQHISTKLITEIDKKQYEAFKKNALYERIDFPWVITGLANDTLSSDGTVIYGTKHKNTVTTTFYNKKMPGLTRLLSNPLEGFQGTRNPELTVLTSQPKYNSDVAGTGKTIDNFIFVPPVEPEVIIPTLVVSPTSINFAFTQSASLPSTQEVYITEVSGSSVSGLYITSQSNWFSASLSVTTTPTTMSVAISSTQLAATTFTSSIIVSSSITQITSPITLPVTASVVPTIVPEYWWRADSGLTTSSWTAYNGGINFRLLNVTTASSAGVVFNGSNGYGTSSLLPTNINAKHIYIRFENLNKNDQGTFLGGTQNNIHEVWFQPGFNDKWFIVQQLSGGISYGAETAANITFNDIIWIDFVNGTVRPQYYDASSATAVNMNVYLGSYTSSFTWQQNTRILLGTRNIALNSISASIQEIAIFTTPLTIEQGKLFRTQMLGRYPA